jgi:hypothetical protein
MPDYQPFTNTYIIVEEFKSGLWGGMTDQPIRIQRKRTKGWRMPPNTVYVGRPTIWGNPFDAHSMGHEWAVELYRRLFNNARAPALGLGDEACAQCYAYAERVTGSPHGLNIYHDPKAVRAGLKGKNLACYCPLDQPCHADVLLELAND